MVSEQLHGAPRLGQGGALRTLAAGLETIDVSNSASWQIMGHEYFYRHPRVLADLTRLLIEGDRAAQRPEPVAREDGAVPNWEIVGWESPPVP